MEKLSICIPTYNREEILIKNIINLLGFIEELNLQKYIEIIVSDNCSFSYESLESEFKNNSLVTCFTHMENLGPEKNFYEVVSKAKTEWIMLLGDDDYIQKEYLGIVFEYIQDPSISVILPNYYVVDGNGNKIDNKYRDKIRPDKVYEKGELKLMFKAHQVSGLVFKKRNILSDYKNNVIPNFYLQMFFVAENLLAGKCIHVTRFPLANTVIQKKSVDYDIDMLLDHILYNIKGLPINKKDKMHLYKYAIRESIGYRLGNMNSWKHPKKMFEKVNSYALDKNIIRLIKISFIFSYSHMVKQKLEKLFIK